MSSKGRDVAIGVAACAAAVVAAVLVLTRGGAGEKPPAETAAPAVAPGYVGAPGSVQAEAPPARELDEVRDQVTTWLVVNGFDGYVVTKVLAFTNNDYVAVRNSAGDDAFELLVSPGAGWIMLEPPSMVWNVRYGMTGSFETNWAGTGRMPSLMGGGRDAGSWSGWFDRGKAEVASREQALAAAQRWLERSRRGERASEVRAFPGYYTVDTTRDGRHAGMLSVNSRTGDVWYHGWHGGFLAARAYG